ELGRRVARDLEPDLFLDHFWLVPFQLHGVPPDFQVSRETVLVANSQNSVMIQYYSAVDRLARQYPVTCTAQFTPSPPREPGPGSRAPDRNPSPSGPVRKRHRRIGGP